MRIYLIGDIDQFLWPRRFIYDNDIYGIRASLDGNFEFNDATLFLVSGFKEMTLI